MSPSASLTGIAVIVCIAFAVVAGCTSANASGTPPATTPAIPVPSQTETAATPTFPVTSLMVTGTVSTPITLPSVSLTKTVTPPSDPASCASDSDCVPAQCCHPDSCINVAQKHVCTLLCTASCQGPIDCGAGHCGCINGKCGVQPGRAP
jgi:hypothetical protein